VTPIENSNFGVTRMHFISSFISRTTTFICFIGSICAFSSAQTITASTRPAPIDYLYRAHVSTGEVIYDTLHGATLHTASTLAAQRPTGEILIGATAGAGNAANKLVYFDRSKKTLGVSFYGGPAHQTFLGSAPLATLGSGSIPQAVADLNGDSNLEVISVNQSNGEVEVYFFGGVQGTSLLKKEMITPLTVSGWNVVGAVDLNSDGHPDLLLQNGSTRQVMVAYLGGANGTTVLSTHNLESSTFAGWTAAGMQDMNGDGHPDLILVNDVTGESIVNYYGGDSGVSYLSSAYLDRSGSRDWKIVVPTSTTTATATTTTAPTSGTLATLASAVSTLTSTTATVPVLIFNGTGTSVNDVTAVKNAVSAAGFAYHTANSAQLDGMTQSQLLVYKLFIVPGGNALTIGRNLSKNATANLHNAVSQGLNYLGFCAGGFFAGSDTYNNFANLTEGPWFNVYSNSGRGTGKEAILISFPSGTKLDIYWQDGPDLSGWGSVVGKYPTGHAAITEGYLGKGFVLLCGVHPEAPASWRYGMTFTTPVDVDLAYAQTLVKSAFNRTMLPHY
jgi:glutamine amidotransferase-like uncharacterized protein